MDCLQRVCVALKALSQGWLDLSSPSVFVPKRTGSVLTLNIDEMISFPFSALIWIRVKMCALVGILLRISASCLPFCLNETAPVVCYEKKKANNPSLNNRAELKKKILAPGCPSASGPGIRLQLAQLHSLAQAIFSRKKTWNPYSRNCDCTDIITYIIFTAKSRPFPWTLWSCGLEGVGNLAGNCQSLNRFRAAKSRF